MSTSIEEAIHSLKPNAEWNVIGDKVEWLDSKQTAPTDSEIAAERSRLDTAYTNNEYQRKRADAYPSIADQLDMQYWDKKNGTTTWVDAVAKVKSDNPKS
jgi:hypothetical protein